MRVVLAIPTYGPVDQRCAQSVRHAIMHAAHRGVTWVSDVSPDRQPYGSARNAVVEAVMPVAHEQRIDGIVWTDSDIVTPPDTYTRLVLGARNRGVDFLTGLYHHRKGQHTPVYYKYLPERDTFRQAVLYEENRIYPVDGCGFGIVYTSMRALWAIAALKTFNAEHGAWFPDRREGHGKFGEDLGFCRQAMLAGVKLEIDTGIAVGHTSDPEVIWREQFLAKSLIPKRAKILQGE